MSKEAMKLALEALEIFEAAGQWTRYSRDSITALQEALDHIANGGKMIEQPAQYFADDIEWEEDALAQPAQQEPAGLLQEIARLHDRIKDLEKDVEFLSLPAQQEPLVWTLKENAIGCGLKEHITAVEYYSKHVEVQNLYTLAQPEALREALAEQPAQQEPVACVQDLDEVKRKHLVYEKGMDWKDPLYTSPQAQRTWVGLTDKEITWEVEWNGDRIKFSRAIEAKLKEKNT